MTEEGIHVCSLLVLPIASCCSTVSNLMSGLWSDCWHQLLFLWACWHCSLLPSLSVFRQCSCCYNHAGASSLAQHVRCSVSHRPTKLAALTVQPGPKRAIGALRGCVLQGCAQRCVCPSLYKWLQCHWSDTVWHACSLVLSQRSMQPVCLCVPCVLCDHLCTIVGVAKQETLQLCWRLPAASAVLVLRLCWGCLVRPPFCHVNLQLQVVVFQPVACSSLLPPDQPAKAVLMCAGNTAVLSCYTQHACMFRSCCMAVYWQVKSVHYDSALWLCRMEWDCVVLAILI